MPSSDPFEPMIAASMLYDLIQFPHRVTADMYADPADRDPVSRFVSMLWEKGASREQEIISGIGVLFLTVLADIQRRKVV
jgi:hypothetical protein